MAGEKGKVVLFGKTGSGRTTLANMLVSGELKDCPLEPTDTDSICKTYVGRGWTVTDTMGFGEPLDGTIPKEYVRRMGIDFLNEVKGCYSHIIFVVNEHDIDSFFDEDDKCNMSIIWKIFLEIFRGGEENYVVVVTKRTQRMWSRHNRAEMDQKVKEMFPQCKQFLYTDFKNVDPDMPRNGQDFPRIEDPEILEKEMKEMFEASPWVETDISKMGGEEIKDMAAKIAHQLTSRLASNLRWGILHGSTYEQVFSALRCMNFESNIQILKGKVTSVSRLQNEMQNLGKEVKFYQSQCAYLFQRSMEASKEIHDLFDGTETNLDERHLELLINSLAKFVSCLVAARKLLHFCGDSKEEEEAALMLSSPTVSGRNVFSKFGIVLRDLDWSFDVFCFWWHNPKAQEATENQRQFWLSKFLWSEARCRLVYVGDVENKVTDIDFVEANVVADNNRQAQDQQDLISSMESHFQNPKRVGQCALYNFPFRKKIHKQLSNSEMLNYMSILKNRLEGSLSLETPGVVPSCFQIPGDQKFKAIQFIGRGSYKEVCKSKWLRMNVAVATFKCGQGGASIIEGEARLLARVQHPNVVTFIGYGYDEEKQQGFLVTELLQTSLRSLINQSKGYKSYRGSYSLYPFTINVAIDILLQIVEAMIHVHECGVIHRDLKAENCLTNLEYHGMGLDVGVVKLIDFGTSELQSTEMGSNFKTPNVGTPPWMAPEVYGRIGDEVKLYTWSADVYSFGMTCYEVVTGEVPFGTIRGRALRELVCNGHRPTIPGNCPHNLKELMMKCWAHNPEDRPTFKDIRQSLWNLKLCYLIQKI